MNLFDYVTVIPEAVPKEQIQAILSLPSNGLSPATVGAHNDLQESRVDTNYRNALWVDVSTEVINELRDTVGNFYLSHLQEKYKKNIINVELPQLLYYPVGGKYELHNDSEDIDMQSGRLKRIINRDLTVIAYLNDNYEGGELELIYYGVKFKPRAGTVIAFPSYIDFTHQVHPVTHGDRISLVTWIHTDEPIYSRPY